MPLSATQAIKRMKTTGIQAFPSVRGLGNTHSSHEIYQPKTGLQPEPGRGFLLSLIWPKARPIWRRTPAASWRPQHRGMHGSRPREWRPAKLVWLFRRMRIGNIRNHFQAMAWYGIRVMADVSSWASLGLRCSVRLPIVGVLTSRTVRRVLERNCRSSSPPSGLAISSSVSSCNGRRTSRSRQLSRR